MGVIGGEQKIRMGPVFYNLFSCFLGTHRAAVKKKEKKKRD